ncbi:MAG: sulfurtransferase [Acidimicrobiia bacterium]|nr:sulfurtransferase [Acidimicrobiia bacterium]
MLLPGPLVDAEWLAGNVNAVDIADVRWSIPSGPKIEAFADGHLPESVFVDLDAVLSDPPGPRGRHPLPPLDVFRRNIADLGLGRRPVVCYDDTSGATAARMWWMLDAIGHPVAVLDGGIGAWTGPLERGDLAHSEPAVSDPTAIGDPTIVDWPPGRMIEVGEVLARIRDGSVLLDARSAERFRGEPNPVDPVLGHIPGGRSRPWTDNISDDGVFRHADHLRRELTEFAVGDAGEWVASCGSGVTACHNLLAARIAGLGDGRLYAGSWSEWISNTSRPVETGPAESGQTAR